MSNTSMVNNKELKELTRWFDHDVLNRIRLFPLTFRANAETFGLFCKNIHRVHQLQNESTEMVNKQAVELLFAIKGITCLRFNDSREFLSMKALCFLTIEFFTSSKIIPSGIVTSLPKNYKEEELNYIYNFAKDEPRDVLRKAYNFYLEVFA